MTASAADFTTSIYTALNKIIEASDNLNALKEIDELVWSWVDHFNPYDDDEDDTVLDDPEDVG